LKETQSTTTQHNNHMTTHSNNNHNINTNNSSSASCFLTKSCHTQALQQQNGFLPFCSTKQKPVSPQLFLSILLHIDSSSSNSWKQEFSNKKCPPALAFRDGQNAIGQIGAISKCSMRGNYPILPGSKLQETKLVGYLPTACKLLPSHERERERERSDH
jgi:hypothetical protein